MMKLKCLFLIQLLILVLKIDAKKMFFRGKYFDDEPQKPELTPENSVQEKWFIQTLDHFKANNTKTWYQRYYVNEQYYKNASDSPVYLMMGGEETISSTWMTGGFWVESAIPHGALLFQLEHRFYGYSRPTENASVENLQCYLTVEQALEDTAKFIVSIKETYKLNENNKVIIFGGSYPGNLVAWLRLKHPELVYGVISSSAPVQAVVDFQDYFKVTVNSLATYSRACVTTISEAFANIDQLSLDATGRKNLTNKLNLCEALESSQDFENDFAQLNSLLAQNIAQVVQYNKVDHSSNRTIDNICNILANKSLGSTSLDRFAALTKILENSRCVEYSYQNFVNYFRSTSWDSGANSNSRQWFFQTCHQLGYFQSSSSKPQVFGNKFPVEHSIKQCIDVFGPQYNAEFIEQEIQNTNNNYGGKSIVNNVDRVVFVQGSIDTWYPAGITTSSNPRSPAIFINGTAHCADTLGNDYLQDSPQLITARQMISSYINAWLTQI